jgi:phosphomannomutase
MPLMFSISGLRGIVGKDLFPDTVQHYAAAFGDFLGGGSIVIGRDARPSGPLFRNAVVRGLHSVGCRVIDCGIVPTPTVLFMVRKLRVRGGIAITASHNPQQWNALKFVGRGGLFLDVREQRAFAARLRKGKIRHRRRAGQYEQYTTAVDDHIDTIIKKVHLNVRYAVGVDAVDGAGSIALPRLLEKMGCTVTRIHCRFNPVFPREPEPTPEHIHDLCRLVQKKKLAIGFACDPDCDRLSIVDERGIPLGEERSLVLATDYVLTKKRGAVVTNLSTTALMEHITQTYGCTLYRTHVGEANVVSQMRKVDAVIGGEGNGGVIYPRVNFTRDALVGAALTLGLMQQRNAELSALVDAYPQWYMIKKKVRVPRERFERQKGRIIRSLRGRVNLKDGVRVNGRNWWVHIRPSQTEPLIRIIGEAQSRAQLTALIRTVRGLLS